MNLSGTSPPEKPPTLSLHSTVPNVLVSPKLPALPRLDSPQLSERMDISTPVFAHKASLSRKDKIVFVPTQLISSPSAVSLASTDSSVSQDDIVIDVSPNILHGDDQQASPLSFTNTDSVLDPKLVILVLDLYDRQRFEWTMIAEPIQRMWGIEATSATILAILQQHGRIQRTLWWD
jgi:hypothetical protein